MKTEGIILLLLISLTCVAVAVFAAVPPTLPDDDPQMRDLIECWQGPGEKKEWRSLTDGQVEVSDGGVIRFSNNGNERVVIYSECRVTYDVAFVK